jgi:hypothetical protein
MGGFPTALPMVRIFFSDPLPELVHVVPLAQACGVGRANPPESALAKLFDAAPALWRSSRIEEADLAVWSNHYDGREEALRFVRRAREAGLSSLLFDTTDTHFVVRPPDESAIVWRTALYADRIQNWERAMPPPSEDLWAQRGGGAGTVLRKKAVKPSIGFCGYVSPLWKNIPRLIRGEKEKVTGHLVRRRALAAFARSSRVRTDFIARPNYFGGALRANFEADVTTRVREQFIGNIIDNDYTLCARGAGNFSIRFYETLSAARIPLLVNTRCALPFADVIDWNRHCVIVDERDMASLPDRLADFHDALTPEAFEQMQKANRALWEQWLEPLAFTRRAVEAAMSERRAAASG